MSGNEARWIWYPGDLELYHAMKQNFSRVERGFSWPAFWKSEGFRNRVVFRREYQLKAETSFTVLTAPDASAFVRMNGGKYPVGTKIVCGPGAVSVSVHIGRISGVPAVYIQGDVICSDDGWLAEDYCQPAVPAASNRYFTEPDRQVDVWPMRETVYEPVSVETVNGGTLYTFETELTASLEVMPLQAGLEPPLVYLGESRAEALDTAQCYYFCRPDALTHRCPRQALRYAFLPGVAPESARVRAIHQFVDIPVRAAFQCDDEELNRIFEVAVHTFSLCCDVFFLDGIKRDKWIWGGDAYQSLFVNRYLTGDREIEQRTLTALRGNDPVTTHVNTIVDYSLLWILSLQEHFDTYGDREYLDRMWPKAESLMALLLGQRNEDGFLIGREKDWVFVDWADFDRDGPLCAEQMFLAAALGVMARFAPEGKKEAYQAEQTELLEKIERCFWDEEQRAYVDSCTSGKRHVTRHANILAIVFGLVSPERQRVLAESVLFNSAVPAITTPYFRFFELDALCRLGYLREVLEEIKAYWGGMLHMGAVTFWEEFDPGLPLEQQYAMYGDPFGKSLCHAWAASPIYLLARYYVGLRPDTQAPGGYECHPAEGFFRELDCTLPVGGRTVRIRIRDGKNAEISEE
ncbi:MAG: alpha-L-rhamnosidase [Clostridia bacterium]|nr:alpha-L-rhamnosidase [Clostridia bacterium]